MKVTDMINLQGSLFALMLIGAYLRKSGQITDDRKVFLTNLCVNIIIPCNIFNSFLIEFNMDILKSCSMLLITAVLVQFVCLLLNKFIFNKYPSQQKKVLQYATIVPMGGFIGNPIAEGLYNAIGIMYTSIYLVPMRIIMWSIGTTYFVAGEKTDKKKVIKNVLTHPCLVSIYLGLICMITQVNLPVVLTRTVKYVGNCNTAISMIIVGAILPDVKLSTIFSKDTIFYSIFRLGILPTVALGIGLLMNLDKIPLGISVLMSGMPAGATCALFAAKYKSDEPFATKIVVISTLLSMFTLPLWCLIIG